MSYESKIWNIWLNNGSTVNSNTQMQKGLELLQNSQFDQALSLFKNLSKKEPFWAEPINKIATIKFLQGDYLGSINDIKSTLKLEPRHFGALSGLVQINIILSVYINIEFIFMWTSYNILPLLLLLKYFNHYIYCVVYMCQNY